jgi:repressor LexA
MAAMKALTPRQRDVLRVIAAFEADNGHMPTYREIAAIIGVSSTNAVNDILCELERKGAIWRAPMKSRAMRITDKGKAELS